LFSRIQRFVKREFELNQRQANIFLLLSILFLILIIWNFYSPKFEEQPIDYTLEYILDHDSVAVAKADAFVKKASSRKRYKKRVFTKKAEVLLSLGDLNIINASELQKIKGVGSVLSDRILKFRDKLGGFYSQEQLYQVYGLDSSVVLKIQKATSLDSAFTKIDINTSNYDDLKSHPYISWQDASALSKLRREKMFLEKGDVIGVLDSVTYKKVELYLEY